MVGGFDCQLGSLESQTGHVNLELCPQGLGTRSTVESILFRSLHSTQHLTYKILRINTFIAVLQYWVSCWRLSSLSYYQSFKVDSF